MTNENIPLLQERLNAAEKELNTLRLSWELREVLMSELDLSISAILQENAGIPYEVHNQLNSLLDKIRKRVTF
jgi:hypothetical protein